MIAQQQSSSGIPPDLLRRARSALKGGCRRQAAATYREIVKLAPRSTPLLVEAARACTLNGDRDEARTLLLDALASGNITVEIALGIALGFFMAGDYRVACEILSDGWQKTRSTEFTIPLMEVLERLGKLEECLALLAELKNPPPRARLIEGLVAMRQKDFSRALAAFSLARTGSQESGDGLTALRAGLEEAKCHERLNDFARAWSTMTAIRAKQFPPRAAVRDTDRKYATKTQACLRDLDCFVRQSRNPESVSGTSSPLLVTGHPRSGTSVVTLAVCRALNRKQYDEPDAFLNALERQGADQIALDRFDEATRDTVRADYFDLLRQLDPEADPRLPLVDKNPVLELRVPRWLTIFPASTVLFVQRHPLDIMVSCLFTYLPPNPISLQYYTPERNASTIETSRRFQKLLLEHFPGNCTAIRYEDFVREGSLAGSNLPDRYQGADAKETTLRSTNYSQAKESVHTRSVRRYEHYLPYLPPQIVRRFLNND